MDKVHSAIKVQLNQRRTEFFAVNYELDIRVEGKIGLINLHGALNLIPLEWSPCTYEPAKEFFCSMPSPHRYLITTDTAENAIIAMQVSEQLSGASKATSDASYAPSSPSGSTSMASSSPKSSTVT